MPEPSVLEVELAIEELIQQKPSGIDQIPSELNKAGGRTIHYQIHKHIISIWNKEELPEWKQSITVPIYRKGYKTDCSNYRGISLLHTTYTILSNILLSRLTPYAEEIIGDHQCGFRCNRTTADHILCICQILERNGNKTKQCISFLSTARRLMIKIRCRSCILLNSVGQPHESRTEIKNVSEWNV